MMVLPPELAPLVNELMAQAQVPLSAALTLPLSPGYPYPYP